LTSFQMNSHRVSFGGTASTRVGLSVVPHQSLASADLRHPWLTAPLGCTRVSPRCSPRTRILPSSARSGRPSNTDCFDTMQMRVQLIP